ncbi:MAG TPA: hypothetical protein V6C84_28380 [Coleofasciculaceae cyanobacterium]|jgi:type I restriction enzyme S subunit
MKVKVIQSTWLGQEGRRLDCSPYLSGAIEAKVLLEKLSVEKHPLHQLTKGYKGGIYNGPQFVRNYVNDSAYGVPFFTSGSIMYADLSYMRLLRKKDAESSKLNYLRLSPGMTLISSSGTIGRMTYARSDMDGLWSSQDVMKVVADPDKILSGYLYAYLRTHYGVPLVTSGTYGAVIEHIEPLHIAKLPVPRLGNTFEEQVHQKVIEAAQLRTGYQIQVQQATQQLFAAVGLADITGSEWHSAESDLAFTTTIKSASSLRAVNFRPKFQNLCESIKAAPHKLLREICVPGTLKRGGRYKRVDAEPEYGCQLIGQKEIFWQQPEGRWVAEFALGKDVFVDPGTTLIAATGTLGESELYCRAEFIWGPMAEMAYSELFVRVVANNAVMPKGCLYAFMRSETAFRMFRSISFGSKLQYLHPVFLPHLPVPYPDPHTQQAIHELVIDAYEKRHRSNVLENEAVAMVERAILEGV